MRAAATIAIAAAALSVGAVTSKLHSRWANPSVFCNGVPCEYLTGRLKIIDQMTATARRPSYLVIGDSLTEIAVWPTMCARHPVPAGIAGARADTWIPHARRLAEALLPDFVVVALGSNDVQSERVAPLGRLLDTLNGFRVISVPLHHAPKLAARAVNEFNASIATDIQPLAATTTDGVHLTSADYSQWLAAIERSACAITPTR